MNKLQKLAIEQGLMRIMNEVEEECSKSGGS